MKYFSLILLTFTASTVSAQSAYYDAIVLKNYVTREQNGKVLIRVTKDNVVELGTLFRNYGNLPGTLAEKDIRAEIEGLLRTNPFFTVDPQVQAPDLNVDMKRLAEKSSLSAISGLDVTTIADGIARFLVERTKQELNIYFFDQFNDFLNDKDYGKDIQKLFPNTHAMLMLAKDNLYNYQLYLQSFREAFAQDLAALLINTNDWVNMDPATGIAKSIQGHPVYPYLQLALQISVDLQQGKHPGDILDDLVSTAPVSKIDKEIPGFSSTFKTANIISQSLRSADGNAYWIDNKSFRAFSDLTFTRIFMGLLYQQFLLNPDIMFKGEALHKIVAALASDFNKKYTEKIYPFLTQVNVLVKDTEQIIVQLQSNTGPGIAQNYISLLNNTVELVGIAHELFPDKIPSTVFAEDAAYMIMHVSNLTADIRTKSYNAAIVELSLILQKINEKLAEGKKIPESLLKGVLQYGTFMANVATAKTSAEVQQAIDVVALPPGSYQVKRESCANISLNGYLGLYGGREYMPAAGDVNTYSAGVFAPVGVAFSFGGCKKTEDKGGKSHSLFISAIDVGALASFRFGDSTTSVAPASIKLNDIMAPGLYYVFGFGRSPISIGVGAQLGPSLREVDPDANPKIDEDYYIRYGLFVAIDIPFLTLYNRKDRKTGRQKRKETKI